MTAAAVQSDLGVYVHIPFCVRKCGYCAFYSEPLGERDPQPVLDAIVREWEMLAPVEPVKTLYIGGGSPTCVGVQRLCRLIEGLCGRFGQPDELTVECNPAQADAALFAGLKSCGVNRLSIGAQSFFPDELKTLGRLHSAQDIGQAVSDARAAGVDNIGLDLIFGIPGSSLETFIISLERALALEPTHLSAYSLTHEEGTPLTAALNEGRLAAVDEDCERQMYGRLCERLAEAGFEQYEISNFAQAGLACRHNLRYWRNLPVIGLGPAASGWYRGQRTANAAPLDAYVAAIGAGRFAVAESERPDAQQTARQTAVLGLRMTAGVDLEDFYRTTGYDALSLFAEAIALHRSAGLLEVTPTHLRLTKKGLSFADAVACDLTGETA